LCCCRTGGINFGKTNLDQFASGLVGTRTPYGTAANAFDNRFIPGGSSSGSAAAVGAGLLCFALGTDTAGSGRVPAGYNGCVGLKGTLGKISTVGEWQRLPVGLRIPARHTVCSQ
jgi:allophanate hydrolase